MMGSGRFGITYEDVVKAISRLKKKKINITIANIRNEIGRGSQTTIMHHLRDWRLEHPLKKGAEHSLRRDMIKLVKIMAQRLDMEVK